MKFPILWETVRERIERAYTTRAQFKGKSPISTAYDEPWQELENPYINDLEYPEIASFDGSTGQYISQNKQGQAIANEPKKVKFATENQVNNQGQQTERNLGDKKFMRASSPINYKTCNVTKKTACNYHCFRKQNSFNFNNKPYYNNYNNRFNRPTFNNNRTGYSHSPSRGANTPIPSRNYTRFPQNRESGGFGNRVNYQNQPKTNNTKTGSGFTNPKTHSSTRNPELRANAANARSSSKVNAATQTSRANQAQNISALEWENENILSYENFY